MDRTFGALRDVHDWRDKLYLSSPSSPINLNSTTQPKMNLSEWCGPIKDQGNEGSCTGHSNSSGREWVNRYYEKGSLILSPQDLYVEELLKEGSYPRDDGAMPRTGCQIMTSLGACEESLYKYVPGTFTVPTGDQIRNALKQKMGGYHRVKSSYELRLCLGDITPWVITVGFQVFQSFMTEQVANSGMMLVPKPGEQLLGGHSVLCVGYDAVAQTALIQNSWGSSWGKKGFFTMPFAVIDRPDTDMWITHTGNPWKA